MATSAEPITALRKRECRGLRRFTIGMSADDLPVIAETATKAPPQVRRPGLPIPGSQPVH